MQLQNLQEAVNYEYYKDRVNQDKFDKLVALDPTPDKKYGRWIVECYIREFGIVDKSLTNKTPIAGSEVDRFTRFWKEDAQKISSDLVAYTKLKNKKLIQPSEMNILNIKSYRDLWKLLNAHSDELEQLEGENVKSSDYEKWYEDDKWLVVVPKTHAAACKYGANTRWCTASNKDSNYFDQYTEEGPLIIFINKSTGNKWQIHIQSDQWMDEEDKEVNKMDFVNMLPAPLLNALYIKKESPTYANFLFRPEKKKYITSMLMTPNGFKAIKMWLESQTIRYPLHDYEDKTDDKVSITDFIDKKLYYMAFEDVAFDGMYDDGGSYDYGYNHPWEILHDQDPELRKEGDSYGNDEDIDVWSEDQRRDAGEQAESSSRDEYAKEAARNFDSDWKSKDYKEIIEKVYDAVIRELSLKYYKEETINTVMNLVDLFSNDIETLATYLTKVEKAKRKHRAWSAIPYRKI